MIKSIMAAKCKDKIVFNDKLFVAVNTVLLLAMIKPAYLTNYTVVNEIWKLLDSIAFLVVLVVYLVRMEYSGMYFLCVALYGTIAIATLINGGSFDGFIRPTMNIFCVIMLFELNEKRVNDFLRIFTYILTIWLVINCITIILFPDGLYSTTHLNGTEEATISVNWFMGFKNGIGKYAMFDMFFVAILEKDNIFSIKKQTYSENASAGINAGRIIYSRYFWFVSIVSFLSVLLIKSALSIAIIAIFILSMIAMPYIEKKKLKLFDVRILCAIVLVLLIVIVFLQKFEFLNIITEGVFKKEGSTFGGRKVIWTNSISKFLESPLIGYGYIDSENYRIFLDNHYASDPHNFYLDIMIKGGFIALLCFLCMIVKCIMNIRKEQYSRKNIICTSFIVLICAMFIAESTSNILMWLPIAYIYMMNTKKYKIGEFVLKL